MSGAAVVVVLYFRLRGVNLHMHWKHICGFEIRRIEYVLII